MVATTKGKMMETQIQCPHCHDDMNVADWNANGGCCIHCGESTEERSPFPSRRDVRRLQPLVDLHKRLTARLVLRKETGYAY